MRVGSTGGGIAIGFRNPTIFRDVSDKLPEELRDQEIILSQTVIQGAEVYVLNVYLNNFNKKKGLLKPIKECLIQIQKTKPKSLVLLVGDLNAHENYFKEFTKICNDEFTFKRTNNGALPESKVD